MPVNWVGVETLKEVRILNALYLALNGKSIPEIARETGIPKSSLYSIRKHGAYAHRIKRTRIMVSLNEKAPHKTLRGLPVACTTSLSRGVCQFNVDLHNLWTHE